MNRTLAKRVASAVFLFLLTEPLFASNLRWLNYSPVRFFTDQDWNLATEAGRKALNDSADGETVKWNNPQSGSHGSLTPISTSTLDGQRCRKLKIENSASNMQGSSIFDFCLKADGKWGAVGTNPAD